MTAQAPASIKKPKIDIDGLILLDKPMGITSNAALQRVKKLLNAKKAGHTGSLDPLATGMLPICLGQATKFSRFLLNADKTYQVTARLGVRTTTGDAEGETVETKPIPELTFKKLDAVCDAFRGEIDQVPSMYSALKYQGKPLYKYARQGVEVPRQARCITIFELKILNLDACEIEFFVHCSKGTYIRSLVDDIGQALGCGAHVTQLRRLSVGSFKTEKMHILDDLNSNTLSDVLLPIDGMLDALPNLIISSSLLFYLRQGNPVMIPKSPSDGLVSLKLKSGEFVGVGEVLDDGRVAPKKIIR